MVMKIDLSNNISLVPLAMKIYNKEKTKGGYMNNENEKLIVTTTYISQFYDVQFSLYIYIDNSSTII
jgi:hypothetical protein